MKVSDLFVKCLENEGVRHVFGVPGEECEDFLFSLEGSKVRFIPVRHEQGAAFMADVWGRLTGSAGVCLGTLGPGATNLLTGVADATLDKSPLVAITGQAGGRRAHHESHQYLDVVNLFRPVTKWNTAITDLDSVAEVVRKAFKIAEAEKPGATHIELAEDVAKRESMGVPLKPVRVRRPDPNSKAVEEAVALLKKARRPLLLAGNGAVRKLASSELRRLSSRFGIPCVDTFMGQGAVSDESPESLLTIGFRFRDLVTEAVEQADLVLSIGYDIAEYAPDAWNPRADKRILHVDFEPAEVYTHYQPAVELVADISATLKALHDGMERAGCRFDPGWYAPVRRRIEEDLASYDLKEGQPFTVPGTLNLLRPLLGKEGLLISDVGIHKLWIARNFPVCSPNGVIISNGLASMGISLPGGIAAALHSPKRRIVSAMGDGGFLMNSQELETARRLGVAFTVLIFNDNEYSMISWKQKSSRGRTTGTKIGNPDFVKYAESFGIRAYRPVTLAQLKSMLKEAVTGGELCVVEVPVDPGINDQLLRWSKGKG